MILISPRKVLNNAPLPSGICLNGTNIKLSQTVRNLGVTLDQSLPFQQDISDVCRTCHLELRRISTIRHHLSEDATETQICAFVLSGLDCCNALLSGFLNISLTGFKKFKTMLLGACTGLPNSIMLHLFSTPYTGSQLKKKIVFKLASLCFKSLNGSAPSYLSNTMR